MTAELAEALAGRVTDALRVVIDPELGYNIVDLGLIYCVAVGRDGDARVLMTTTTRGCPATSFLKAGVHEAATGVPGIERVDVMLTYDPPWTPQLMAPEAKEHLGIASGDGW
jgi:metal-sulfur cluster biosynthetic enzyme